MPRSEKFHSRTPSLRRPSAISCSARVRPGMLGGGVALGVGQRRGPGGQRDAAGPGPRWPACRRSCSGPAMPASSSCASARMRLAVLRARGQRLQRARLPVDPGRVALLGRAHRVDRPAAPAASAAAAVGAQRGAHLPGQQSRRASRPRRRPRWRAARRAGSGPRRRAAASAPPAWPTRAQAQAARSGGSARSQRSSSWAGGGFRVVGGQAHQRQRGQLGGRARAGRRGRLAR